MKKHLKLTALFLAAVLSLSIPAFAASDAPTFTAKADSKTVDVGEEVEVVISVKDNPGISCLVFDVNYDNTIFSCAESDVKMESLLSSNGFAIVVNPDNDGMLRIVVAAAEDVDTDGKLFTLTFHAKKSGTSKFELLFEDVVSNMELIDANTNDASVTVNGNAAPGESTPEPEAPVETPEVVSPAVITFSDVPKTHWAYSYIQNVVKQGLFTGISNNQFGPDMNVTRGMFVTVLYSNAGAPAAEPSTFSDVAADAWYSKCVSWASEQGIVSGIGNNKFGPELSITREQLALILYQYAKGTSPGTEAYVRMFYPDGKDIHDWALTAMSWAVNEGLISGKTGNRLAPQDTATRAEVAVIMQNFVNLTK